jgi:hypothetical protein
MISPASATIRPTTSPAGSADSISPADCPIQKRPSSAFDSWIARTSSWSGGAAAAQLGLAAEPALDEARPLHACPSAWPVAAR